MTALEWGARLIMRLVESDRLEKFFAKARELFRPSARRPKSNSMRLMTRWPRAMCLGARTIAGASSTGPPRVRYFSRLKRVSVKHMAASGMNFKGDNKFVNELVNFSVRTHQGHSTGEKILSALSS